MDLFTKLQEIGSIMEEEYEPTRDIFSVHPYNSLSHHLCIAFAFFVISWPLLGIAWAISR